MQWLVTFVMAAEAAIHDNDQHAGHQLGWIPAFAGMTFDDGCRYTARHLTNNGLFTFGHDNGA